MLVRGIAGAPLAMQKDEEGTWSVTTDALAPDLDAYSFLVDGLSIVDPSNTTFRPAYGVVNQSAVLVPGSSAWTPRPHVARVETGREQHRYAGKEMPAPSKRWS